VDAPLDLRIRVSLPEGWTAAIDEDLAGQTLAPGEERLLHCSISMLPGDDAALQPPLDGIVAAVDGSDAIRGVLTKAHLTAGKLNGLLAIRSDDGTLLTGGFAETLSPEVGRYDGMARGCIQLASGGPGEYTSAPTDLCLRPLRTVTIEQWIDGEPIGGISVRVQVPMPAGSSCHVTLPPTDTLVAP
jgi:hypothetical protein